MPTTYGWQSKRYPFGANRTGDVATSVQSHLPGRMLCTTSYHVGTGDRVRIVAKLGGTSELVLLDHTGGSNAAVDRRDAEITLADFANVLPGSANSWYLSYRVEITTDYLDPTPEDANWPFANNETVSLYLYKDLVTQANVVRTEPADTGLTRAGVSVTSGTPQFLPLAQVQTVFYFTESGSLRLRAATAVSDTSGRVRVDLPAGTYDVEFYGAGFQDFEYKRGFVVGAGTNLAPWSGSSVANISQAAEFGQIKAQFSTLYWPGYMVAEDFSPERAHLRDESAETNSYGNNYALQLFGRVFAGKSYVEFVGIAVDPPPE